MRQQGSSFTFLAIITIIFNELLSKGGQNSRSYNFEFYTDFSLKIRIHKPQNTLKDFVTKENIFV